MRKSLFAASILALSVAVAPACATKKFVRGQVGEVNTKVDTLSGSLEETQERTRKNEERIGAVDTTSSLVSHDYIPRLALSYWLEISNPVIRHVF